ncbi:MAG: FkbM family methyltransferase [Geminicoccaceae bacterium]
MSRPAGPLDPLLRKIGYVPRAKAKPAGADDQLAAVLAAQGIDCVLDVGANVGQYARRLRRIGYAGRIVSFEPSPAVHAALADNAAGDALWQVAPAMALAAQDGEAVLQISAESDMSSLCAQRPVLQALSPSSAVTGAVTVRTARLDGLMRAFVPDGARIWLKLDVQGAEAAVLDGAAGVMADLCAIQSETALLPMYEGELELCGLLERLAGLGFEPHLILPGYFERKLGRMTQVDVIACRPGLR